jgi:hypothetical protein
MMEEFVSFGTWWLPNRPEVVVSGKLSFSPSNGASLELIGSFYDSVFQETGKTKDIAQISIPIDFIKPNEIIILGLLDSNEEITLYQCFGYIKRFDVFENRANIFFKANYIFRKVHFYSEQEIKFKSISVKYSYLEEWLGKSGIQVVFSKDESEIRISYQHPVSIPITEIEGLDIEFTFGRVNPCEVSYFGENYYKCGVEQKTFFTLQNPENRLIDRCVEKIMDFRDFLGFAMLNPLSINSVIGSVEITYENLINKEHESREIQVNILLACWGSEKYSEMKVSVPEMMFFYSDIEGHLGNVFKAWLHKKQEYESVFELFLITMYTPELYLHYGFLNMIQALEVYHSIKYKGTYQEDKTYKEGICKKILEAIEDFPSKNDDDQYGISEDYREVLKGKLNFLNQHTLQTRLTEILDEITYLLPDDFIGDVEAKKCFISRASNTRHALTHHNKKKKKKNIERGDLSQLFYTLRVILSLCLLKELDFSDESIKQIIGRNRKYQREWRSSI